MGMPNRILVGFERTTGLGSTGAARLLGMPYITYAQYRSGKRSLKLHHKYHIEVLLLLGPKALERRIREIVNG